MNRSLRVQLPVLAAIRIIINTAVRMVYPFLPVFGRGLGVGLEQLSLALTVRSGVGAMGPFLASVGDSRGRKAGMLMGLALFIIGLAVMAAWPVYPAFVVSLALTMLGNLIFIPSMQAHLGDRVPYERRGLVLAISEVGWSLSFIIGVPLVGLLIARYSWRAPFPLLSGLGLLAAVLIMRLIPGDARLPGDQAGLWRNLRAVFTCLPGVAGLLMGMGIGTANELVNMIFGSWMENAFGLKIAALGAASAVIGFSELGGELLVGAFTDRLGKARAVMIGMVFNTLAVLVLPWLGSSLNGALAGLFLIYISFEFTIVSSIPLMTEILPAARATYMATWIGSISLGRAIGDVIAPPIYHQGFSWITLAAALLNLAALTALLYLRRRQA